MQFDQLLVTLGVVFLAGLAADQLGRMTRFPRVTMLILLGVMAGNTGFGLLPNYIANWFDELAVIALTMVAFLLGNSLTKNTLAQHGRAILAISLSIVVCTLVIVSFGLTAIGLPIGLSVLLAALATATDPAAVADVVRQSGLRGGFVDSIKGIVAIDDAWGLIFFSFALVLVSHANGWPDFIAGASWDLGGAAMLGCVIGFPSAFLTGRLKPGEPMQAEAIGIVFLTAGLALLLEVSFLITGMTVGAIIANFARHHDRPFYEIEHIQWLFMILFFLLAGATLEFEALGLIGWAGLIFLVLRSISRLIGGYIGARIASTPRPEAIWFGPALLPQAGVAVGMALVAKEQFPQWGAEVIAFTLASTVVFEVLGPPMTLYSLRRVQKL